MKVLKINSFILFCALFFSFTSCSNDDVDCSDTQTIDNLVENQLNEVTDALTAFSNNPNDTGLCNNVKNELQNFLDLLRDYESCAEEDGQGDEFRSQITDAENQLAEIDC